MKSSPKVQYFYTDVATLQNRSGKTTFTRNCEECEKSCQIRVKANRCFNHSVHTGDDRDPTKFFTTFEIEFIYTEKCGNNPATRYQSWVHGGQLWPGRLVYPGNPMNGIVDKYLSTIKSCSEFGLNTLLNLVEVVPPATPVE